MAFEKFAGGRRRVDEPMAVIYANGKIGFNTAACVRFRIREFSHAVFYFDRERSRVGVDFVNHPDEGAVRIASPKDNRAACVSARNFLAFCGVPLKLAHCPLRKRARDRFPTFKVKRSRGRPSSRQAE